MPARRQRKCILVIVDVIVVIVVIVDVIVVIVVIGVIVIVVIAIGGIVVVVIAASIHSLTRSGNHKRLSQTAINGNQRLPRGASVIYCTLFQFNFLPFFWGLFVLCQHWQLARSPPIANPYQT
jgi:hypothetical protein